MTSSIAAPGRVGAFFDVDGTLVKTTIVHYYAYFRRRRLPRWIRPLWYAIFLLKCGYFLLLDKKDRSRLNVVFYRSYAGLPADEIRAQMVECYRDVIEPRRFQEAAVCVQEHRENGDRVVFVTGSIDFTVQPLAEALQVRDVVAPSLLEENGRFTGALDGPPLAGEEKAAAMRAFAEAHDIDLSRSHAYGDSMADLPMLEAVGFPHVVNPNRRLHDEAKRRGWPVHRWTLSSDHRGGRA